MPKHGRKKGLTAFERKSKAGKIGGKARMASLSGKERLDLARKGGHVGGRVRAEKLSPDRRRAIAAKAAMARWEYQRRRSKRIQRRGNSNPKTSPKWKVPSELPIYSHFQRIAKELEEALLSATLDNAPELFKKAGDELWEIAKQPERFGFPLRLSARVRKLIDKGCSSTHLTVHSILYAMMCAILERQDSYSRRLLALPGVRLTRVQFNKQLARLEDAAKAAGSLWASLRDQIDVLRNVSPYAIDLEFVPVFLTALCECARFATARHATHLDHLRTTRDAHLILLAVHVKKCVGRYHWDLLADLVDPWTAGETVTADVLRLRFSRRIRHVSQEILDRAQVSVLPTV